MKGITRFASGWMFLAIVVGFAGWSSAFPTSANAQAGQNAVYNSSGTPVASPAFIDASMFATSPPPPSRNFCGVLNYVLAKVVVPTYPAGAVIDARGLNSGRVAHPFQVQI